MQKYTSLDLFFETGLRHLYKAEKAILDNLRTLEETASFPDLKQLFRVHRNDTENQIRRLERIFAILDIDIHSSKLQGMPHFSDKAKELLKTLADMNFTDRSKGIDGILNEGKELFRHFADTDANDFAVMSSAQKVEHFEIACYSFLGFIAQKFGDEEIVKLLNESLFEEVQMEKQIADFALANL